MLYKDFRDLRLPALGLGCMRLPTLEDKSVDTARVEELLAYAMAHGVNYFDTGYDYHGGMSEQVLGQLLSSYPRESYFLADKFPGYDPFKWKKVEKIFNQQLARCRAEHFDFYLFHNVCEMNIDAYLNPKFGIFDYLYAQKQQGRIRYLGFSVHGSTEVTRRFLEAYGEHMDFAQIQLNYLDYKFQRADEKLALLAQYGIPVWVMEPLRGGRLCAPQPPFDGKIAEAFPGMPCHEVAFRFLQSIPQVQLVLSGMSSLEQLKENTAIFSERLPLSGEQQAALIALAEEMTAVGTVPCTGCGYCAEHCPAGLEIPRLLSYYNEHTYSGGGFIVPAAVASLDRSKRPTACLQCGRCETVCPQNIKVKDILAQLSETLGLKK